MPRRRLDGGGGYLGGALLAVLLPIALPGDHVHAAAPLVPRRARDYLPRRTLAAPAVAVALSLVAVSTFVWAPRRPEAVGDSAPWGAVVLTLAVALATVVGARWGRTAPPAGAGPRRPGC
ncbi:MAG: hypothetical protein ACR2LJ_11870 [Acidimicrobiales bacterium]